MRDGLSISLFAVLLFAFSTPALAGAPPECETDEQCQEWGYEVCGTMGCEGGEAMDNHTEWEPPPGPNACMSDADCPEGQRCAASPSGSSGSGGACINSSASDEDTDLGASDAGESEPKGTDEEVSSGCQGSQTPAGLALFALGLIGLTMRSRRLRLER